MDNEKTASINLDGIKMKVVSSSGVIGSETIFTFWQTGNLVYADYVGGDIIKGFLAGKSSNNGEELDFRYVQLDINGNFDSGTSTCDVFRNKKGNIEMREYFAWTSRKGEGKNILKEIKE
jgi:hypothetical protein